VANLCQCQACLPPVWAISSSLESWGAVISSLTTGVLETTFDPPLSLLHRGSPGEEVHQELPLLEDVGPHHYVAEQVLQTRKVQRRHVLTEQALFKWSGLSASLVTWENVLKLKISFLRAPAWGQAVGKGVNVMSPPLLMSSREDWACSPSRY
jgi:hypothetical protein